MKKIFVISGSPRVDGNSDLLAQSFIKGAQEASNEVVHINSYVINLKPCIACNSCWQFKKPCVFEDDNELLEQGMKDADVIVFVTPVYFFGMTGQMKVLIDKLYPFIPKLRPYELKIKDCYLISCCWDKKPSEFDSLRWHMQQISTYMGWNYKEEILINNCGRYQEIKDTEYLDYVYQLGLKV
ncbi:MAG: flavodoxin family protein [Bacilli bacterium]|jgi:multimeric flavodoxin WrbA|nr:flavodoxin family protein [Bacilli bacterium]